MRFTLMLMCSFLFGVFPCLGQELVMDFNENVRGFENTQSPQCFQCGDLAYFVGFDARGGELWKTDGTVEGTEIVKDVQSGFGSGFSDQNFKVCANSRLYFTANKPGGGTALWETQGTEETTILLLNDHNPRQIFYLSDAILFTSDSKLWSYNLLNSAVSLIRSFDSGIFIPVDNYYYATSNSLYVNVLVDETENNYELWVTDGTEEGTQLLGFSKFSASPFVEFDGKVFFSAAFENDSYGRELWCSDGTPSGTQLFKDLNPGPSSSVPGNFYSINDKLILSANSSTYYTDGTIGSVSLAHSGISFERFGIINDRYFRLGTNYYDQINRLYELNPVDIGITFLAEIGPRNEIDLTKFIFSNRSLPVVQNQLVVPCITLETGLEICTTSGGVDDLILLKDINLGALSSLPEAFTPVNDKLVFLADDGVNAKELWITDGTSDGTNFFFDGRPGTQGSSISAIASSGGKAIFGAGTRSRTRNVWISDATTDGTKEVLKTNEFVLIQGVTEDNAIVLDGSDQTLYKINMSSGGASPIETSVPLLGFGDLPFQADDIAYNYFQAEAYGVEIWRTDINQGIATLLKDINPGPNDSWPVYSGVRQVVFGNKILFSADDGVNGFELWVSDGTASGTNLVLDINEGSGGSISEPMAALEHLAFFSANSGSLRQLWKSDGTTAGTTPIDFVDISNDSDPLLLKRINDRVYFSADDGVHGKELWVTDGTELGTAMIDLVSGSEGSHPKLFSGVGDWVYFVTNGKTWRTKGTPETTFLIAEVEPLRELVAVGDWLLIWAYGAGTGEELYRIPIIKDEQEIIFDPIPVKTLGDADFNLIVSSTSGLNVIVSSDSEKVNISDKSVSLLASGKAVVYADQPGNSFFESASTVSQTFCINPPKPIIEVNLVNLSQPKLTSSSSEGNIWYLNGVELTESSNSIDASTSGTYKLKVAVDDCESEFSEDFVFTVTGLEDVSKGIQIYPVPAQSELNISSKHTIEAVQILDFADRAFQNHIVVSKEVKIDTSDLPNGVYFARIVLENSIVYKKWIKK